jgi:long-chain acyl-CoA synthetase
MFHIAGLEGFSFTTITAGGTICVMKAFDPVKVAENIRNEKLNWAFFVAAMYRVLLDVPRIQEYLSSIRVWGSAAAPMPSDLHHKIVTMFPNVNLFEAYGQTENPKIAMGYHNGVEKSASCGKIAFHSAAIIVDANGKEMPIGEAGEVVVQAPYIMKGYYKNNEETEKVWEGGWLHTGDIGKLDSDGYLYLLDRKKDMIISGAENVYAVEVENVLATNPKIKEVAVIGLPDVKWGEKVTAVVVLKPNESATEDEIIEYAKANMTRYKCPKSVKFTDSLPKSALMKVLKQELRKKYGNT